MSQENEIMQNALNDSAQIRLVDSELVAAANARDLDRWLNCFAPDAKMLPPGAPPVEGKAAICQMMGELLTLPNFFVAHHLQSVKESRSGDIAWVFYDYEPTIKGANGKALMELGKDISIYEKQPDGSWKVVIDMWSSNAPEPS